MTTPLYTPTLCHSPAYQLNWSYTLFWREVPPTDLTLEALQIATEPDGIRILQHEHTHPKVSQFLISTRPEIAPKTIAQRVKGRLQHLIRKNVPKAFQRNYALRSIGSTRRSKLEAYLESQLDHHPNADPTFTERLEALQLSNREVDFESYQETTHARYWHNLHIVLVNECRYREGDLDRLTAMRSMLVKAASKKGHQIGHVAMLPDHLHFLLRASLVESPQNIVLAYMNNLAYAVGQKSIFAPSYFVGTFSEYDLGAIPS